MGELDAIATALSARLAPGHASTILTFRVDEVWLSMTARLAPHLELSMPTPELAGLTLRLTLGVPTLLDDGTGIDERWDLRTNDEVRAGQLLAEAPWPSAPLPRVEPGFWATLARGWLQYMTFGQYQSATAAGITPPPRYVLEVIDGVATIERRTSEIDEALAVGAARRLVQLVTRTGRRQRAMEAEARRPRLRRRGPYR